MPEVTEKSVVPTIFESKYPGLILQGREVKDAEGVKKLDRIIRFKPVPLKKKQSRDEGIGLYATTDPKEIEWLRGHKNFNKHFREIERGAAK